MSAPATIPEATDQCYPDRRILVHWEPLGVDAGVAGTMGRVNYRLDQGADAPRPAWEELCELLGAEALLVSRQPHGTRIAVHESAAPGVVIMAGYDGHISAVRGTYMAVTVADCVPVYLAVPERGVVGVLHAGWRGVAAGIVERGIGQMVTISRSSAADVVIHCGISICGSCYEVGPEVWEAVGQARPEIRAALDLRANIADRALACGVKDISVSSACTAHDAEGLQSHRRQGEAAGRMAAYVGLPNP